MPGFHPHTANRAADTTGADDADFHFVAGALRQRDRGQAGQRDAGGERLQEFAA